DEPVRVEVRLAAGGDGEASGSAPDAAGSPAPDPRAVLERLPFVRRVIPGRDDRTWVAECVPETGTDAAPRLARTLVEAGLPLEGMRTQGRGLDDIYLRYFQGARGEDSGRGGEARRGDTRDGGVPGAGGPSAGQPRSGASPSTARTEVRA
ncbi:MAG: hypothetical protein IRZ18_09765, partial [Clostridia bacterium]|nr:hypothetical protein [Clostridia bacterium]